MDDSIGAAFQQVLAALDRLEIQYCVGGSVASSSYGIPRQTKDIDIVVDFGDASVQEFCSLLSRDFYLDVDTVEEAVRNGHFFNLVHFKTAYKFDFYPAAPGDGFRQTEIARRRYSLSAVPGLEGIEFALLSPEDSILSKLVWYRKGGEMSERQWHDILGIVKVQAGRLDVPYMKLWAAKLAVSDLLDRVMAA